MKSLPEHCSSENLVLHLIFSEKLQITAVSPVLSFSLLLYRNMIASMLWKSDEAGCLTFQ
jgi:hypothetical protein